MYQLFYTNRFRKDVKLLQKRGLDMSLLKSAIRILQLSGNLPAAYNTHKLSGEFSGFWEAHIQPNWLIIWSIFPEENEIWLTRTGTHSDLF